MKDRSQQPPNPNANPIARSSSSQMGYAGGGTFNENTGVKMGMSPMDGRVLPSGETVGRNDPRYASSTDAIPQPSSNPMLNAYAQSGGNPNATVGSTTGGSGQGFNAPGYGSWGSAMPPGSATTQTATSTDAIPQPSASTSAPAVPATPQFGPVQNTINTSNVPGLVGGDALGTAMKDAQDASYKNATGYLDPQWERQQKDLEGKLLNQGVTQGSEAWNNAMNDQGRQKEFAYSQARSGAVSQGNAAQNQLFTQGLASNQNQFGQNSAQAQFYNNAQQQMAAQGMSEQQIQETIRQHLTQEGLSKEQIDNLEQQNRFQNSLTMRNQDINELLLQQSNPLNMLNLLNNGGQVQQPQFTNTPGNNMSPADIMSAFQNQYSGQLNSYNAQTGTANSQNSAMAAIIAAYLCDRRLKKNIRKIGMHKIGVPLYEFDYLWDEHGVGVMADELEAVLPEAVLTLPNGYKFVDYGKLQ